MTTATNMITLVISNIQACQYHWQPVVLLGRNATGTINPAGRTAGHG
jgi:hypothetical protein